MATEALVPNRSAPARIICSAVFQSLIPPLALTLQAFPTVDLINDTAWIDAPPAALNPVDVLTKSAPAITARIQASMICSSFNKALSRITFTCTEGDTETEEGEEGRE